ncbi:MAG TPA: UDP-glucose 4-epimerase GalE [Chloroflexi bacterium]|nr:UDP-glucose 4-epimerase GalE [Chloroflexota bacterium]HCU97863.1 UDP-glucose 4-epimerase GalE [Chloroflexota bacterium]
MDVLVTGGAGYIGGIVSEKLLSLGYNVTIYDNLSRGNRKAVPNDAVFIEGDLKDRKKLNNVFSLAKFDIVFHLASYIEAGESMEIPEKYFVNNVTYSHNLIELAVHNGCRRFVFSSTAAVYASSDEPLREDSEISPTNVYGETKLMVERMLYWYQKIYGLRYVVLRYFNASGAIKGRGEAHIPETHLIPRILQVALGQQEFIRLYGTDYPTPDGTCIRDYIHVLDLAEAHILAANVLHENNTLYYNLGTGVGYSNQEIVNAARRITGHDIPVVRAERRDGDAVRLVANYSKIRNDLGWKPINSDLDNIISSAWEWHRKHPHLYNSD